MHQNKTKSVVGKYLRDQDELEEIGTTFEGNWHEVSVIGTPHLYPIKFHTRVSIFYF